MPVFILQSYPKDREQSIKLSMPMFRMLFSSNNDMFGSHVFLYLWEDALNIPPKYRQRCSKIVNNYALQLHSDNAIAFLQTHLRYVIVFSNIYTVILHRDFILNFSYAVDVVWSVLAFLARNHSHRKEGRGEGRNDNSFSGCVSPGNMDATVFANLDLSMSTVAKGSTDKLLWVLQSDSSKLLVFEWNNNFFFFFLTVHTCLQILIVVTFFFFLYDSHLWG